MGDEITIFKISTLKEKRTILLNVFRAYAAVQENNYDLAYMYAEFAYEHLLVDSENFEEHFGKMARSKRALAEGNYGRAKDLLHDLFLELNNVLADDVYGLKE